MTINYHQCHRKICVLAHCSADEAWDALSSAYLSLDTTRTEAEQYWWLIRIGVWNVKDAVRVKYTSLTSGELREQPIADGQEFAAEDDDQQFLKAFPEGFVREFAERLSQGGVTCTVESVRSWLRRTKPQTKASSALARSINESIRVHAKKLL